MSDEIETDDLTALAESWRKRAIVNAGAGNRLVSAALQDCAAELRAYCNEQPSVDETDYHQKPIAAMSDGELRAYRRELARNVTEMDLSAQQDYTANTMMAGYRSNSEPKFTAVELRWKHADAVIEHERREE